MCIYKYTTLYIPIYPYMPLYIYICIPIYPYIVEGRSLMAIRHMLLTVCGNQKTCQIEAGP